MQISSDVLDFIEDFFALVLEKRSHKDLLRLVIRTAMKLTDSQMGNIFSYNRKTGKLDLMVSVGFDLKDSPDHLEIGSGAAGSAAKYNHPVLIESYSEYMASLNPEERKKLKGFAEVISSSIGVPLTANGLLLGSIAISRKKDHRKYDSAQTKIAEFFSRIASLLLKYSFHLYRHENRIVNMRNRIEFFKSKSNIDPLTNIFNRRTLEDFLTKILNSKGSAGVYSVIMADIDRFKLINDNFGHLAGDEVLKQFASVIRSNIRETDKAFRYGGEEFIIILNTPVDVAVKVAEKMRQRFAAGFLEYENKVIKYTASFGVAPILIYSDSVSDCMERADNALYIAKRNGRNRVEVKFP